MHIGARCFLIGIFWCLLSTWAVAQENTPCDLEKAAAFFKATDYYAAIDAYELILENDLERNCQVNIYYKLGEAYSRLSSYRTATVNFELALKILGTENNSYLRAKSLSGIAYAQSRLGNFKDAYTLEMEALKIAEAEGDGKSISRSVYQLGNYAQYTEDYQEALEHYLRVKGMMDKDTTSVKYATLLGAIGSVYIGLNDLKDAIDFLERSAEWGAEHQNLTVLAYALGNLGEAHAKAGNLELAMNYIGSAIEKKEELGDLAGVVDSKLKQGKLWLAQKRFGRAEAIFLEATREAEKINAKVKLLECYQALKDLFSENGQYEKAFLYLDQYTKLKNEVLDENMLELIEEQKTIYKTAEKEAEIKRLKEIQFQRDQNDRLKAFIVVLFICVAFSLLLIGYRFNRQLSEKNTALAAFGKRLERKNMELEHFAHIASHDLKAPLRTVSNFTNLLGKNYVQQLDDKAQEYMRFISESVINMQVLLDDLLWYARVDYADEEMINTESRDLLETALQNLCTQIEKKNAKVIVAWETLPGLKVVPSQLVQVFQNLVANALKFSNKKEPIIKIDGMPISGDVYRFSIQDNGIGIAAKDQQRIFEMFSRLRHEEIYKGSGIGLATCKKIITRYGGEIWVDSKLGKGATFYFTIPGIANKKSRTV